MKKCFTYGSVRGAARKGGSYRDSLLRWESHPYDLLARTRRQVDSAPRSCRGLREKTPLNPRYKVFQSGTTLANSSWKAGRFELSVLTRFAHACHLSGLLSTSSHMWRTFWATLAF